MFAFLLNHIDDVYDLHFSFGISFTSCAESLLLRMCDLSAMSSTTGYVSIDTNYFSLANVVP